AAVPEIPSEKPVERSDEQAPANSPIPSEAASNPVRCMVFLLMRRDINRRLNNRARSYVGRKDGYSAEFSGARPEPGRMEHPCEAISYATAPVTSPGQPRHEGRSAQRWGEGGYGSTRFRKG